MPTVAMRCVSNLLVCGVHYETNQMNKNLTKTIGFALHLRFQTQEFTIE